MQPFFCPGCPPAKSVSGPSPRDPHGRAVADNSQGPSPPDLLQTEAPGTSQVAWLGPLSEPSLQRKASPTLLGSASSDAQSGWGPLGAQLDRILSSRVDRTHPLFSCSSS